MLTPQDWAKRSGLPVIAKAMRSTHAAKDACGCISMPHELVSVGKVVADVMQSQNLAEPGGRVVIAARPGHFSCDIHPPPPEVVDSPDFVFETGTRDQPLTLAMPEDYEQLSDAEQPDPLTLAMPEVIESDAQQPDPKRARTEDTSDVYGWRGGRLLALHPGDATAGDGDDATVDYNASGAASGAASSDWTRDCFQCSRVTPGYSWPMTKHDRT